MKRNLREKRALGFLRKCFSMISHCYWSGVSPSVSQHYSALMELHFQGSQYPFLIIPVQNLGLKTVVSRKRQVNGFLFLLSPLLLELTWANHFFLRTVIMKDRTCCPIPFLVKNHMIAMGSALLNHALPHSQYRTVESPLTAQLGFSFQGPKITLIPHSPATRMQSSKFLCREYGLWENSWTHKACLQCSHPHLPCSRCPGICSWWIFAPLCTPQRVPRTLHSSPSSFHMKNATIRVRAL